MDFFFNWAAVSGLINKNTLSTVEANVSSELLLFRHAIFVVDYSFEKINGYLHDNERLALIPYINIEGIY